MSDIQFNCQYCNQSLEAPDDMRGESIDCPACGKLQIIPGIIIKRHHERTIAVVTPNVVRHPANTVSQGWPHLKNGLRTLADFIGLFAVWALMFILLTLIFGKTSIGPSVAKLGIQLSNIVIIICYCYAIIRAANRTAKRIGGLDPNPFSVAFHALNILFSFGCALLAGVVIAVVVVAMSFIISESVAWFAGIVLMNVLGITAAGALASKRSEILLRSMNAETNVHE